MAPCFADIIQSHQFVFLIGEEEVPISVHASALAATSDPIKNLIYGSMKEAGDNSAKLEYITPEDFIRFCEYAYRGDYAVPSSKMDDASPMVKRADNPPAQRLSDHGRESWYSPPVVSHGTKYKGKTLGFSTESPMPTQSPKSLFRSSFQTRTYSLLREGGSEPTDHFAPRSNVSAQENFTPVFLAYARLYTFARMHLISNLETLTLSKLHKTLVGFRLYEARIGDIITLARHAYCNDNTPDRKDDGSIDGLRKLVVDYIVSMLDVFGNTPIFVTFLEEGGEFVGDLFSILQKGLLSTICILVEWGEA